MAPVSLQESYDEHSKKKEEKDEKKKHLKVPFLKLFSYADSYDVGLMALGSIGACAHGVSVPVFFIFFGKIINTMGLAYFDPRGASRKVSMYSLDFVYLSVVILFSSWVEVSCWMYTGERQAAKLRMAYLRSMLTQDITSFDVDASTGEVIAAITSDILIVQDAISEKVGNFLHYISRFLGGFVIGFIRIWQIALVTVSILPFIALAGGVYAYVTIGLISKARKNYVKAGEIAEEIIGNVRTVQAFAGEERAALSYTEALRKAYKTGTKIGFAKGLGLGTLHCVLFLSWSLLIWFTSIVVHKDIANGGEAFTAMLNMVIAGLALGQALMDVSAFSRAKASAYSIFEMIESNKSRRSVTSADTTPAKIRGDIELKSVAFSYPSRPDAAVFTNLSFQIPSGKIVALVGGSGSGKSTVISLIERFYEPSSGRILLDGNDIKNLDLKWLRNQIGLVNQEPALFATTIRENILYGKQDATLHEISNAAKLSEAASFINNLPDRFETHVGERGIQLSGGQKQRIAIARAIVKNPTILLLDEATSALDAESERSVQDALDRVMVGRTTLVIAHRLSTIRNADIIAVVQDGNIVETGAHQELVSNPTSVYSSLLHCEESSLLTQRHSFSRLLRVKHSQEISPRSLFPEKESEFGNEVEVSRGKKVSSRRMYSLIAPDWAYGVIGTVFAFIAGAQTPLFALGFSQALVSYYMDWNTTQREIKKISILFICSSCLTMFVHVMEHLCYGIMAERLTFRVRRNLFSAILKNEIGWFDREGNTSSQLTSRLENDAALLKTLAVDRLAILLQNFGLIVCALIITFVLNWRLTLVVLATFPLVIVGHISEKIFMKGYGGNLSKAYLKANMLAAEAVSNIRTVAAFCAEEKILSLYGKELIGPAKAFFKRGQIAGVFYGVSQFFIFSSYGLALWYGSILIGSQRSTFKSVMKSFMILIVAALIMGEILAVAPDIYKGSNMIASIFEILDRKTQIEGDKGNELAKVEGCIELREVKFSYPSRPQVAIFKNMNIRVLAGTSMALVGKSGSGKSSVLGLILRFYDPTAGRVLIDGADLKTLKAKFVRKHIGLVQQEPALFATSILENIKFGKEGSSESEAVEAAKLANAHNFICSLPEGYNTNVGERGVQLSGGQKQRVAIARAILKDPEMLLLDEATSALDVESERVVQQAIDRLMKNRTTVIVAHRLSTIKNADLISVVDDGKIAEQGTHSNLVKNPEGAYFNLIKLQQQMH